MIRIVLGNVGSGKTASTVREFILNRSNRRTFSNIRTKHIPNNTLINFSHIVKKTLLQTKQHKDGTSEPVYGYEFNDEFWSNIKEPLNIVLDEAHTILYARDFSSRLNKILSKGFLPKIRRILGSNDAGYGELVLITQVPEAIDVSSRRMATSVHFCRCHYIKSCKRCGHSWNETNDDPEPMWICPACDYPHVKKHSHRIEKWHFPSMNAYDDWMNFGHRSYHRHYFINDIEDYFKLYNSEQWEDLFKEV